MATNVMQLTGPNVEVEELQHCPTLYHVDVPAEELGEFLQNPEPILTRLGIPVSSPLTTSLVREEDGEVMARPRGCCYVTETAMICHRH